MARKRRSRVAPVVKTDGDTTTVDTGIYRRTIRYVEPKTKAVVTVGKGKRKATFDATLVKSPDELRADVQAWNAEPARTLELVRQQAIHFYSEYAVEVADMAKPPLQTAMQRHDLGHGLRTYQLPEDAPPIARDAGEVLKLHFLVGATDDPRFRQIRMFQLGRVYERMLVRQLEHRALVGLRKGNRNREIAQGRRLTDEQLRQRWQAVQDELHAQAGRGERISRERAYDAVARRQDVSAANIKKAFLAFNRSAK